MPEIDGNTDSDMKSGSNNAELFIDLEQYRKIVRSYIDLVCIATRNSQLQTLVPLPYCHAFLFYHLASLQNGPVLGRKGGGPQQIRSERRLLAGPMHVPVTRIPSGGAHH